MRERSNEESPPSRTELAAELCRKKGWLDHLGRPRVVSARILLGRLQERGLVQLPAPRPTILRPDSHRTHPAPRLPAGVFDGTVARIADLGKIAIVPVLSGDHAQSALWNTLMDCRHYLGAGPLCGKRIRYLICSSIGVLGGLSFSAPAWHLKARDKLIGWREPAHRQNLQQVVCNSRFLLVPRVPHLASHVLAKCLRRLPDDWERIHGYRPLLVETFVDSKRFDGTCYAAAGFEDIGMTKGRGRQDRRPKAKSERSPKRIFIKALDPEAYEKLRIEPVKKSPLLQARLEQSEFGNVRFEDRRLKSRLFKITRAFVEQSTANIPQAFKTTSEAAAAYRFFSNKAVDAATILKPHFEATLGRAAHERVVLSAQDTTSFNFTSRVSTEGLGPIGNKSGTSTRGLHLHSSLLLSTAGTPLGLIDAQFWARNPKEYGKSRERYKLPIEKKESRKWLAGYKAATDAQNRLPGTTFVSVGDREYDIYEVFLAAKQVKNGAQLLVRALHRARCIVDEVGKTRHLEEYLESLPIGGTMEVTVKRNKERKSRDSTLELRYAKVSLKRPFDKRQFKQSIEMWAILARESTPPAGEEPIDWMLLTTMPVTSEAECKEKITWYTKRWRIEELHRAVKSGCKIEARQLRSARRLMSCMAIDLVVGYHMLDFARAARETPDAPCTSHLKEYEWMALVAFLAESGEKPTIPTPTLREAARMVGRLGGFLGRKRDGEPGAQVIWRGMERLSSIARSYAHCWGINPDTS